MLFTEITLRPVYKTNLPVARRFQSILLALLILLSFRSVQGKEGSFRLVRTVTPIEQQIELKLDPSADQFSGRTMIKLTIDGDLSEFTLSGRDYVIKTAQLKGKSSCRLSHKAVPEAKVKLMCDQLLLAGEYELSVTFTAPYNQQSVGLYKTTHEEIPYLFTQFEMADARRVFPVFDEPEYKIPFQLTVIAPSSQKVYANTPLISQTTDEDMTTHVFAKTPPIPSYLIAMAVGPFEEYPIVGLKVPGRVITVKGRGSLVDYATKNIPLILNALEDYFGSPYVYQKLDSVAVPEFPFGAMENVGLVTYREDLLLVDEKNAARRQKMYHFNVVAHELAHQWYGNLVTMKWWDDLWLNEAFASWMANKITIQLMPEFNLHMMLPQNYVMKMDARSTTKPIRKAIRTESDVMDGLGLAYSKGSAILSMIENWIGEEAFQKGIRAYMKRFAYQNAVASDLWDALSKASGQDVAAVLRSFVTQASFPLIQVSLEGKTLRLSQSRFVVKGQDAPAQMWSLPIVIKYGRADQVKTAKILMNQASQELTLEFTPEWIYPDQNAFGYYRWVLSDTYLKNLLKVVSQVLSDRERSALLSSVEALVDAGLVEVGQFLSTSSRFVSDPHPQVARTALNKLKTMKETFSTPDQHHLWVRLFSLSAEPAMKRYGVAEREGEDPLISELRSDILFTLGFEGGDKKVMERAQKAVSLFLKKPEQVSPYLAQTFLNLAALQGDLSLFQAYRTAFENPHTPEVRSKLLSSMGFFQNPDVQAQVLEYALKDKITPPDLLYLLRGMTSRVSTRKRMSNWVKMNLDRVLAKLPPHLIPYLPSVLSGGCDEAELDEIKSLFSSELTRRPELKRTMEKLTEVVSTCVAKQTREGKAVMSYLMSL